MTFWRTLQLALGSAAIACMMVVYYFGAPLWPTLLGALAAVLWTAGKAWRQRPAPPTRISIGDKGPDPGR